MNFYLSVLIGISFILLGSWIRTKTFVHDNKGIRLVDTQQWKDEQKHNS
ncbi:hypothetical protein [Bacillus thuringiensis]|nr:hypothetical protein [Bacillus thuringiensis]MCU7667376.1 hypothetical protein [Bacillus thuringiensis]